MFSSFATTKVLRESPNRKERHVFVNKNAKEKIDTTGACAEQHISDRPCSLGEARTDW